MSVDMHGDITKCPVMSPAKQRHTAAAGLSNADWWPNQLNLKILHQNQPCTSPMADDFCYATEFNKINLDELKAEIVTLMTTCLLYTSPSPRDLSTSRMPSSA